MSDGLPAYHRIHSFFMPQQCVTFQQLQVYVMHALDIFVLTATHRRERFDAMKPLFLEMINQFRVDPP